MHHVQPFLVVQEKDHTGSDVWVIRAPGNGRPINSYSTKQQAVTAVEQMVGEHARVGAVIATADGRFDRFIAGEEYWQNWLSNPGMRQPRQPTADRAGD